MSKVTVNITADEIKNIRKELKLTQEQLASAINVHKTSLVRWEIGDSFGGGRSNFRLYGKSGH